MVKKASTKKRQPKSSTPGKVKKEYSEIEILESLAKNLFKLIGVKSTPEVSEDVENDGLTVNIRGEGESGLLIGSRGKTLESLQIILGLMLRQVTDDWKRVIVNVSDYREKEEERLRSLAIQTAQKAKAQGEPQFLYNLSPSQRRIVHMVLSEDGSVTTESQGEGKDRFLIISPKK